MVFDAETEEKAADDEVRVVSETSSPVPGLFADPHLVVFDGVYYLYPTTDGSADWAATSFRVLTSTDLVRWHDRGEVLNLRDVSWASSNAWAPAIAQKNGRFYLYFTAESQIGVAVSDSPLGPFVDIGRPLVAAGEFSGRPIDPSVFTDDDGTSYLSWGNTKAHIVQLNADMVSFDHSTVITTTPSEFREAVWLHKRAGIYYQTWSVDDTRSDNYHVRYSTGPGPFGPWTYRGVLLSKRPDRGVLATGHHSILQVPGTDDWIIAYHRFAIPDGDGFHREVMFDRLLHGTGGLLEPVDPGRTQLYRPLT